jgi:hypothetical protein
VTAEERARLERMAARRRADVEVGGDEAAAELAAWAMRFGAESMARRHGRVTATLALDALAIEAALRRIDVLEAELAAERRAFDGEDW